MKANPPGHPGLQIHQLHIWQIDLQHPPHLFSADQGLLSAQETERMQRLVNDQDRRRYLVSHCALRIILSRYLNILPHQVQYQYADKGKPFLIPSTGLFFNLAHSHEIALVAVSRHQEIGVDVECIRPMQDIDQLAKTCFSPREYQEFSHLPASINLRVFFNGWTRKEAYIKAIGEGLSLPLDQFEVSLQPWEAPILTSIAAYPDEVNQWIMQDIPLGENYAAAFALKARSVNVSFLSLFE